MARMVSLNRSNDHDRTRTHARAHAHSLNPTPPGGALGGELARARHSTSSFWAQFSVSLQLGWNHVTDSHQQEHEWK